MRYLEETQDAAFFILRITPESFQNRFSKVSAYAIERKNSVVLQELRQ